MSPMSPMSPMGLMGLMGGFVLFLLFLSEFPLRFAVGEVEGEFQFPSCRIEIPVTIGIGREVEALRNEVTHAGLFVDVVLPFEFAEVFPIHDNESWLSVFPLGWHYIVTVSVFGMSFVSQFDSLSVSEEVHEL